MHAVFTNKRLSHLGFCHASPCAALAGFVHSYWFIDACNSSSEQYLENLHPDGGFGFIFNYGDKLGFQGEHNVINSPCFFDGTNTKTRQLALMGKINAIGVRFKPSAASAFMSMPLNKLKNEFVSLSDAGLDVLADLHDQLADCKDIKNKIKLLDRTLVKCLLADSTPSSSTLIALQTIKDSRGLLPIESVARQLGIHQRKLERLFAMQVGMSPTEYSKTLRAECARACLKEVSVSYSEIQFELGYFDQSHFINQFKSVVGMTPGQYRRKYISG